MFKEEALWISNLLKLKNLTPESLILDVGSSTEEYRSLDQPFIDYYIFKPLRERGCKVVHADAQVGKGIDWVFDFTTLASHERALGQHRGRYDVVICANLLEHVENRSVVLKHLKDLSARQGLLILTVPNHYRYHAHPIDTMYRPSLEDLEGLFDAREFSLVASSLIEVQAEPTAVPLRLRQRLRNKLFRRLNQWTGIGLPLVPTILIKNRVACIAVKRL